MTRKDRIAIQRAHARKALAELRCIEEYFGVEDDVDFLGLDYQVFSKRINDLEKWIFEESPIA